MIGHRIRAFHSLSLMNKYWLQIENGKKTVEGRIFDGIARHIRAQDIIQFSMNNDPAKNLFCKVTKADKFDTFEEMLRVLGLGKCLPDVKSIEEGVAIYHSFSNYAEREKKFGVVGFSIEHLPDFKIPSKI